MRAGVPSMFNTAVPKELQVFVLKLGSLGWTEHCEQSVGVETRVRPMATETQPSPSRTSPVYARVIRKGCQRHDVHEAPALIVEA